MNRRVTLLLLLLVLFVAPAANLWCSTVCVASAISSGCAHGLQPTDDLPADRASAAVELPRPAGFVSEAVSSRGVSQPALTPAPLTPLRI